MRPFLAKAFFYIWRHCCLVYTHIRHPWRSRGPALLLRYETAAQQRAYLQAALLHDINITAATGRKILAIIPFRDKWTITHQAVQSLIDQRLGQHELMIALVDNGSSEPETKAGLEKLLAEQKVPMRVLRYDLPFNFSKLNNLAVAACNSFGADYLLFLNNDVKLIDEQSVLQMVSFMAANQSCASTGCTLLYPDLKIQHLFLFVGCKIVGAHPYKGRFAGNPPYANDPWMQSPRPVAAATAAFLLVRHSDFNAVAGFDEKLPNCYQDVDLALKFQEIGKINWVLPYVRAIHYETFSRSPIHSWDEVQLISARWGTKLTANPYISTRFSRWSEQLALTLGEGAYPWRWLM